MKDIIDHVVDVRLVSAFLEEFDCHGFDVRFGGADGIWDWDGEVFGSI